MVGIMYEQGDILKVEGIKDPVLVVSTNYYNKCGKIIICPVVEEANESVINIPIDGDEVEGIVLCDQLKSLDITKRGTKKIDQIDIQARILIADVIQGLFDYI